MSVPASRIENLGGLGNLAKSVFYDYWPVRTAAFVEVHSGLVLHAQRGLEKINTPAPHSLAERF